MADIKVFSAGCSFPRRALQIRTLEKRSLRDFLQHAAHFRGCVLVPGAFCSFDSVFKHVLGLGSSSGPLERLRGHEITVGVVGVEFKQARELA